MCRILSSNFKYCLKDQHECISSFWLYMSANFLNGFKISDIDLLLMFRSVFFFNLKTLMLSGSRNTLLQAWKPLKIAFFLPTSFSDNHGQKSWDTFAFLGRFPIHTGPTPPLTPQTTLEACIQNFFPSFNFV